MNKLPVAHSVHIDYMRALAIISVFCLHYSVFFRGDTTILTNQTWHLLWRNGYYGVTTFFVISGYLITSRLLQRYSTISEISLREFYKSRTARILPGMWLLIGALLLLSYLEIPGFVGGAVSMWKATFYALTFRANVIWDQLILPWLVLWSLAVEEVFYLCFPLLLKFLPRSIVIGLLVGFVVVGFAYRKFAGDGALFSYLGCFEQIAMGCLAAYSVQANWIKSDFHPLLLKTAVAIWLTAYLFLFSPLHYVVGPSSIGLSTAMLLVALSTLSQDKPNYGGQLVMLIGALSYEIYLIHLVFLQLMRQYLFVDYSAFLQRIGADLAVWPLFGMVTLVAFFLSRLILEPIRASARR